MRPVLALPLALAAAPALTGCVDTRPPLDETTSLRITLADGFATGSEAERLPDSARAVQLRVEALDAQGQIDPDFDFAVQVYAQFLGTLTPSFGDTPLAEIALTDGVSPMTTVQLPPTVFGPTVLWLQDGGEQGSYATGTAPKLWFRDPFIRDIQTPASEVGVGTFVDSPLEQKQVKVTASRHGARGRLVVNGIYAQGYTLSDVQCADDNGTPPCTAGDYDHVLIFSFSRPKDERGRNIQEGQFVDGFAGGVQEFNGLTEIGFPQSFVSADPVSADPARIPAPVKVERSWLTSKVEFERNEAGLIMVEGATACELDDDWTRYKQWKLDLGSGCRSAVNVVTTGVIDLDPATLAGKVLPRVTGVLKPNGTNGQIWIMYPRSAADLVLQ